MNHYIKYLDWLFTPDKIRTGNLYLATSLLSSSLEVNSLTAEVECTDPSILDFERNTPLSYYSNPDRPMIFQVQSITRTGPSLYKLHATSTLGLLTEGQHMGGIYTGQTAGEIIADICGTVPFIVKTNLIGTKLYGWLPIASPRDNLSQVLFAIGAALKTDLDGILRIEGLWDGISSTAGSDRMYTDASVGYDGKITQVIVTEHQYVPWTEEEQLFEGTAQQGDIITFDNPMHSLTATGFAILDSGANWAKVSAGSGVLTGKTYIHNTRQITKDVFQASDPNVKTVKDATLVSLVNSQACAQRLADYYKCREHVDAHVVYKGEIPGDLVATYHPFDKNGVSACLESADITLSNTIKAHEKSLIGFSPTIEESSAIYESRILVTSSQTISVPDGVFSVYIVLIGGGSGGWIGENGEDGEESNSGSVSSQAGDYNAHISYAKSGSGGLGGSGGIGGDGGKIYSITIDVEPNDELIIHIGSGGIGQTSKDANASPGGNTTVTINGKTYSSASGAPNESGYYDVITGKTYASIGSPGANGGSGGTGYTPEEQDLTDPDDFKSRRTGENGTSIPPNNGGLGGYGEVKIVQNGTGTSPRSFYYAGGAGGGGSTEGADGSHAKTITGGAGANGLKPSLETTPGKGGTGGPGGGGGGGGGGAALAAAFGGSASFPGASGGKGGSAGPGGDGASGAFIMYYGGSKNIQRGQFLEKNGRSLLERFSRRFIV